MVTVELIGGLGNQMFQIAACIAYAKRHGQEFHIPLQTANSHSKEPYFTGLVNPDYNDRLNKIIIQEKNFHYDPLPSPADQWPEKSNYELIGYFQSYKYFEGQKQEIIKAFGFINDPKPLLTVAIHVRRGDYLLYPTKHPVVTERYLKEAIEWFFIGGTTPFEFKFFSDDIPWCKQFAAEFAIAMDFEGRKIKFSFSEGQSPKQDMQEMINCQAVIMSNGTFAWWGAYLNPDPGKAVIYPATWFGPDYAGNDTKDLCPEDWVKI